MQIVVKKKVLEALVDKVVREVSSFHSVRIDEIPAKVDEEDVIKPAEEMSTQLSQQKPKVDDPAYKPVNTSELTKAASALAEKIPQDKTEVFYKRLKDLTQRTADDKDEEAALSEARIDQIVSYLVGRPTKIAEARKGKSLEPGSPEGKMLDVMIKDADANVRAYMIKLARHDSTLHGSESLGRMAALTMSGVYALLAAIAKKQGEQFRNVSDLDGIKAELMTPGALILSDDKRKMTLRAAGTTVEVGGFAAASNNVTREEMQKSAEDAVAAHFDDLVEFIVTGHFMGDPESGIKREKEGTLRTEANDVAKEVLIQLGNQLPINSSIPDSTLRSFADELAEFIKTTLSPENNQFSFTFTDLAMKVKKGKKGEESAEDDLDAEDASTDKNVVIDLAGVSEDIQKLPAEVGVFARGYSAPTGQKQISRVNTAEFFKEAIATAIVTACEGLLDKYLKLRNKKFTAGSEGRNLASDILRRLGGSRRDVNPAAVNAMVRDIAAKGAEADQTPEEIERQQFQFLYSADVLSTERAEMRDQLFNTFIASFFHPAVFLASSKFENSKQVSKDFQRATNFSINQVDDVSKDSLSGAVYDLYTTVLKEFGDKKSMLPFFRTYNTILDNPEFSKFVADRAGATGLSDLSRSKAAFFDKDATLILIVNLASEFATRKLRQPTMSNALTGKKGGEDEDSEFFITAAFDKFCERDLIKSAKDGDPDSQKLIDKVADIMDQSNMGFVRVATGKNKKDAAPVNEISQLRSMIRRAIR